MKNNKLNYLIVFIVFLLFTILSCSKQENGADLKVDKAAIKEVLNQYEIAANSGNFDLWISLWAEGGVRMEPGAPSISGVDQITEEIKPIFEQMKIDFKMTSVEEVRVFGDIGLSRGSYNVALTPKAGGDKIIAEPDGKALTIYERQSDGTWKILYDCFNSNISQMIE
jgi:uncharacterized protein (TIGR02246 family)